MGRLKLEELADKNNPEIFEVFRLSFEYLLASISEKYSVNNKYQSVEEFNLNNSLSYPKILMYPFFISLSNGHSKSLFNLFGDFYALALGPVSISLYELINGENINGTIKYFDVLNDKNLTGLTIKSSAFRSDNDIFKSLDTIKTDIRQSVISLNGEKERFESVEIISDYNDWNRIFKAIDSGIEAITLYSPTFFNEDTAVLTFQASYFDAYKNKVNKDLDPLIHFSEIEDPDRRPFYHESVV